MKPGRNDPCHCGSGKKYKHCCMDARSKQQAEIFDEIAETMAINPNLTIDELNIITQHRMNERNNRPNTDFCGLSPMQMANWLYSPIDKLALVTISTPGDLSSSPVMRYLSLIVEEAMNNGGSFKATAKGNLPTKLVKQASDLLPEFAVSKYQMHISFSEFAGSNEDKFNALHYTRVLAELAGIIYLRGGHYHVKKSAQKQYLSQGIQTFFKPMLEAAVTKYNWGYLDGWEYDIELSSFWLFMLWRLQSHSSIDQLIEDVCVAFPQLVRQMAGGEYYLPKELLYILIELRFIDHFLQFWGFVTIDPRRYLNAEAVARMVQAQPLLKQAFQFTINA